MDDCYGGTIFRGDMESSLVAGGVLFRKALLVSLKI